MPLEFGGLSAGSGSAIAPAVVRLRLQRDDLGAQFGRKTSTRGCSFGYALRQRA
jgi:hypothetical protein